MSPFFLPPHDLDKSTEDVERVPNSFVLQEHSSASYPEAFIEQSDVIPA